jgi:hypothetical protein
MRSSGERSSRGKGHIDRGRRLAPGPERRICINDIFVNGIPNTSSAMLFAHEEYNTIFNNSCAILTNFLEPGTPNLISV